jgi:hypothetical protein
MNAPVNWRFASASVAGTSHIAKSIPCQDYHAVRVFRDTEDEPTLVIAVSDGAGSASRSSVGSSITCQTVLEQLEIYFEEGGAADNIDRRHAGYWLDAIREAIASDAAEQECSLRDYACTLLLAVIGVRKAFYLQIGDGAIVASDSAGEWSWVFWPSRGEFANTTYFVTDEDAAQNVKIDTGKPVAELAVFTDGIEPLVLHYASKSVHSPFFEAMFPAVRNSPAIGFDEWLAAQLKTYLSSPIINNRTGDDKTLVLATSVALQ